MTTTEQSPVEGELQEAASENVKLAIGFKTSILTGQLVGITIKVGESEGVFSPQEAQGIGLALIRAAMNVEVVDQMRQQAAIQQIQSQAVPGNPLIRP